MFKDIFPVKVLTRRGEVFAGIAAGKTGWAWPLGLYAAAVISSSLLLSLLPAEFAASLASDLPLPAGRGFWASLIPGLPGGLGFALFFCALLAGFLEFLKAGRLMFRLPAALAAVAAYALFFMLRSGAAPGRPADWLPAAAALAFAARSALRGRDLYARLLKAFLSISVLTVLGNLAGGAAVLLNSAAVYKTAEYALALLSLSWLLKAVSEFYGASAPRALAAAIPAMLGSAAFAFSLFTLGLLNQHVLQTILLM